MANNPRSSKYQHRFAEAQVDSVFLESFDNAKDYSEHYKILNQLAIDIVIKTIYDNNLLSDKEFKIVEGFANDGTQSEVGGSIGISQSDMSRLLRQFASGPSMEKVKQALANSDELWLLARQLRDCEEE